MGDNEKAQAIYEAFGIDIYEKRVLPGVDNMMGMGDNFYKPSVRFGTGFTATVEQGSAEWEFLSNQPLSYFANTGEVVQSHSFDPERPSQLLYERLTKRSYLETMGFSFHDAITWGVKQSPPYKKAKAHLTSMIGARGVKLLEK